jgi:hypothetical protein
MKRAAALPLAVLFVAASPVSVEPGIYTNEELR